MDFEVKVKKDKNAGTVVMTIKLPADSLAPYKEKAIAKHVKDGEVPGFRKGKAPRAMLVTHYGETYLDEFALRLLACDASEAALEKEDLKAGGRVRLDLKAAKAKGGVEFTATFTPAEEGEESHPELPWPVIGALDSDDDEKPYGRPPMHMRKK